MLPRLLPSAALLSLSLAAPALAQFPTYDADWVGYDTSHADEARWPQAFDAGDLDGDGDLDYAVVSGASVPGLSILRNRGDGSFAPPTVLKSSAGEFWDDVRDVELVDLDRDGDLDAAVTNPGNWGLQGILAVHENTGGGFLPYVQYATADGPVGVAAADLDGDGWSEVVTANHGYLGSGETVSVLPNDGAGGLLAPLDVVVGPAPLAVAAGDLDGDGDADVAVGLEDEALVLLDNLGGLAFSAAPIEACAYGGAGTLDAAVELGDLEGDGDVDVVYTSTKCGFEPLSGAGAVALLRNQGGGTFAAPELLVTAPETQGGSDLALLDWNGDGFLDVAVAHLYDGEWHLFESDGPLGFHETLSTAGSTAVAVDGADLNGDGRPELVVLGGASLELCVVRNEADGELVDHPQWPLAETAAGIFDPIVAGGLGLADVDGDGDLDLGTAYYTIQLLTGGQNVLRNRGDGTFEPFEEYASPKGAESFAFADLDGDGAPDMVHTDAPTDGRLRSRRNGGSGSFGTETFWPALPCDPEDLVAFDATGDGAPEAVVLCTSDLVVRVNDGAGRLDGPTLVHGLTTFGEALAHGDVDADGVRDVVTGTHFVGAETSLGHGDGTFGAPIPAVTDWGTKGLALADLDADGLPDLAAASWSDDDHDHPTMAVCRGLGDGSFAAPDLYLGSHEQGTASNAGDVVAADPDLDGDLDLATGNYWSNDVSLFENLGDGTFAPQVRYGSGPGTWATVAGDLDGDGADDLVVGLSIGHSIDFLPAVVVLPSNGDGAWTDLGGGLAGSAGVPQLSASAPLVGGGPVSLSLAGAAPAALGAFAVGFEAADLPLLGGIVVPALDVVVPLVTDAAGAAGVAATWPAALPPGTAAWAQAGVLDPGTPLGVALSNALAGTQL